MTALLEQDELKAKKRLMMERKLAFECMWKFIDYRMDVDGYIKVHLPCFTCQQWGKCHHHVLLEEELVNRR